MKKLLLQAVLLMLFGTAFSQVNILPSMEESFAISAGLGDRTGPIGYAEITYINPKENIILGLFGGRSYVVKGDELNTDFIRYGVNLSSSLFKLTDGLHAVGNARTEIDSKQNNLFQATGGLSFIFESVSGVDRKAYIGLSIEGGYLYHKLHDGGTVEIGADMRYRHFLMGLRIGNSARFKVSYLIY